MRILILYAKYGGGHISAANAIHTYIEEHYLNADIKFIDCIEEASPFLSNITTTAYEQMVKRATWAWKKMYYNSAEGLLLSLSTTVKKHLANNLLHTFKIFLPDIVISTHPFGTQIVTYLKQKGEIDCKLATIFTDFAPHHQWLIGKEYCDYFFVSSEKMKQDLIAENIPSEKIYITGIPISNKFLLNYNKETLCKRYNLTTDKKIILFFGRGAFGLGYKRSVQVLRSLASHIDKYQIIAISGQNEKMNTEFLKLSAELNNSNLHVYRYTNEVPELMSISSLVVTKPGGLTSSESLASGLPLIIINPIPGQEEENAKYLENSGAGIWIKPENNIEEIIDSVLLNEEKLENLRKCAINISHKNSTSTICKILMEN